MNIPILLSLLTDFLPNPYTLDTGSGNNISGTIYLVIIFNPLGLFQSEANFAKNLL